MNSLLILLIVVWIICGAHSVIRKDNCALGIALAFSILIGMGYFLMHRSP